jgi:hypothetical protein
MTQLSAPAKSGYLKTFDTEAEAQEHAAELCHCHVDDLILVESPDGGTTYCYGSQEEADADRDGAYAVQYREWSYGK